MVFTTDTEIKAFGGKILKLSHESSIIKGKMNVNIYLPPTYSTDKKIPVLLYLSGLTCTPNNVTEKGFWYPFANKYGFALVFPDTSPRDVIDDERWYVGCGAGYYVDATTDEWNSNYKMYSYIDKELPSLLLEEYTGLDFNNYSISGHSMGGFGSLLHFLTSSRKYKSCSLFAPQADVFHNTWSELLFSKYLGEDQSLWLKYDLAKLMKDFSKDLDSNILVHVGLKDPFYDELKTKLLVEYAKGTKLEGKVEVNEVEGYDHSYFFISSFVEQHAAHHAKYLGLL